MFLCLNRQERQEHKGKSELSLESENLKLPDRASGFADQAIAKTPSGKDLDALCIVLVQFPILVAGWYEVARQRQAGSSFSQYWQASSLARYWLESRER